MWVDTNNEIMNVLDNIESKKMDYFPAICPICGERAAHLYFHRYTDNDNKGGMWIWCSSCKHSTHAMFKIPKWWTNLDIIRFEKLNSHPDILEENKLKIDVWLNKLLHSKI